jgi:glycosyltransferase involved in cell wall biosynthesis
VLDEITMTLRILYEAYNLNLKQGTGIATYARNLVEASSAVGNHAELLVESKRNINRKDPKLAEITMFEDRPTTEFDPLLHLSRAKNWAIGSPFGMPAVRLSGGNIVIDGATGKPVTHRHPTLAGVRMDEKSYLHFQRYGALMNVRSDRSYDIFHATHPIPLKMKGAANVYTLHDIVPLRLPYATLGGKQYFYRLIKKILQKSDHIVTVSEFTKSEIISQFDVDESKITNTWQSVSIAPKLLEKSTDEVSDEIHRKYGLNFRNYYLFYGAIEPKKNISRLIEAHAGSGSPYPLIIVGGLGWLYEKDVEAMKDERHWNWKIEGQSIKKERRVQHLPYLPRSSLISLVRGARAVLFPSVYEGFGLPVLEAMLLGTPVVTSNSTSLAEVAADAAVLVDPYDVGDIRKAINMMDADDDLRADLTQRGYQRAEFFSPEKHAERIQAVYKKL